MDKYLLFDVQLNVTPSVGLEGRASGPSGPAGGAWVGGCLPCLPSVPLVLRVGLFYVPALRMGLLYVTSLRADLFYVPGAVGCGRHQRPL